MSAPVLALLVVTAALLAPASAAATTYRWVDEHGTVHYSDQPPRKPPAPIESGSPAGQRPAPEPEPSVPPRPPTPLQTPPPVASPRPTPVTPARAPAAPAPAPKVAPPPAASRPQSLELAREVVELSGIDRYLENLALTVRGEFGRLFWRLEDGQAAWQAVAPLFRRDVMTASATEVLARHLESQHTPALLDWLRSPLYRRINRLEVEASSPASQSKYRQFVSGLPDSGIPPRRLATVQKMERASRAAEFQVEMERAVRQALRQALSPLLASGRGADGQGVEEAGRDETERMRVELLTVVMFAYRTLTDAELEAYARFEASPAGLWASGVFRECLREALRAAEQRATLAIKMLAFRRASGR